MVADSYTFERTALGALLEERFSETEALAASTPFCSPGWLRAWYGALGEARSSLEAWLVTGRGGDLAGFVPLMREPLRFRLPGQGVLLGADDLGAPDHCDLLLPSPDAARELAGILEEQPWERLRIANLAPLAPLATALADELMLRGHLARRSWGSSCFFIDLPPDVEAYMPLLGSRFREGVRRKDRKLHKQFRVELLETAAGDRGAVLRTVFRWNRERFGPGSAFHDPRLEPMLLEFCAWLAKQGALRLWEMHCDGRLAAAWLGFAWGDALYFYQAGWDSEFVRHGIGTVLTLRMIERAIAEGFRRFDFLRGDEPYKQHWSTGLAYTWELAVYRRSLLGSAANCLESGWAAFRPLARSVKRTLLRQEQ
jgi:CelD/BcsL family acetyltransferase involved in cellulose biosynthesis